MEKKNGQVTEDGEKQVQEKLKPQIAHTREELLCFSTCIRETQRSTTMCKAQRNPNSHLHGKTANGVKTVTLIALMKTEYGGETVIQKLGSILISISSM